MDFVVVSLRDGRISEIGDEETVEVRPNVREGREAEKFVARVLAPGANLNVLDKIMDDTTVTAVR